MWKRREVGNACDRQSVRGCSNGKVAQFPRVRCCDQDLFHRGSNSLRVCLSANAKTAAAANSEITIPTIRSHVQASVTDITLSPLDTGMTICPVFGRPRTIVAFPLMSTFQAG